jgi:hypothetical protein
MSEMRESVKAARKLGLGSDFHWWDNHVAVAMLEKLLTELRADPTRILCVRPGIVGHTDGNKRITLWHYTTDGSEKAIVLGDDDDGEDASWPCPPFCPPGGP